MDARLTPRLENVREELKQRDSSIEQVSNRLQAHAIEHAALQRQLEDRDRKVAFLDEQAAKREVRVEELIRDAAGIRQQVASLSTELAESSAELRRRDDYASEINSKLRVETYKRMQFERRAKRLDSELRNSQLKITEQQPQLTRLEHEIEEIRASWSWRLTLPLRKSVDLIKATRKLAVYTGARLRFAWVSRSGERRRTLRMITETGLFDERVLRSAGRRRRGIEHSPSHSLLSLGSCRRPESHPLFDAAFYRQQCADWDLIQHPRTLPSRGMERRQGPSPAVQLISLSSTESGCCPVRRESAGALSDPTDRRKAAGSNVVRRRWYLRQYPDVAREAQIRSYIICHGGPRRAGTPVLCSTPIGIWRRTLVWPSLVLTRLSIT